MEKLLNILDFLNKYYMIENNPEELFSENNIEITSHITETSKKINIINIYENIETKPIVWNDKKFKYLTNNKFIFGYVKSFKICEANYLTTLEGSPMECDSFSCYNCPKLKSLFGMNKVNKSIYLAGLKKIYNLEYICNTCEKYFIWMMPNLINLTGASKNCKIFSVTSCNKLESLEGAPEECIKFECGDNKKITSLEFSPKKCITFDCSNNINLKSLEYSPEICEIFICSYCKKLLNINGISKNVKELYCVCCNKLKNIKIDNCEIIS